LASINPVAQPSIFALPLREPLGDVTADLAEIAPIVNPAQLLQTIVIDFARHIIELVAQKIDVTALPGGFRQNLADCRLETGMIVGDDKLDAKQPALFDPEQKVAPARSAFPVGELDAEDLAAPPPRCRPPPRSGPPG
jgi:hypothetical protein